MSLYFPSPVAGGAGGVIGPREREDLTRISEMAELEGSAGPVEVPSAAFGSEEEEEEDGLREEERSLRRMTRRLSAALLRGEVPTRKVEVRLRNATYRVPVRTDEPPVQTIWNQNVFYRAYMFFRRLDRYCSGAAGTMSRFRKVAVLHRINLVLEPGKVYLVLAPPGGGKTTLLKAIAGSLRDGDRSDESQPHFEGRIEYNGITKREDPDLVLQNVVSYVGQLDNHAPYLTVKETFDFAFMCRAGGRRRTGPSPPSGGGGPSQPDRGERFTENLTIDGLGLGHVADTFVGNDDVRGVSGGQRRRVTVGEMMQGQSPVACADEISTGLDAQSTYEIIRSVVCFAKAAMTTRVISLLQPGTETFGLFDEVILLSEGRVLYSGPIDEVVGYFESLGYYLPATMDVADFLQMIPTPDGSMLFRPGPVHRSHLTSAQFAEAFKSSPSGGRIRRKLGGPHPIRWTSRGGGGGGIINSGGSSRSSSGGGPPGGGSPKRSAGDEEYGRTNAASSSSAPAPDAVEVPDEYHVEYQNSMFRSTALNLKRHYTLWIRDKGFVIGKTFENIGMAAATGGILFGQARVTVNLDGEFDQADSENIQKMMSAVYGALFMACFHILQGTMTASPDEIDGRGIHYKHADANFYQTSSFIVGRLVSTFPQRLIESLSFGIPLYFMVGFALTAKAFFVYLFLLFIYTFALKLLFSILANVLSSKAMVQGFGTFIVLLLSLFGGFMVAPDVIPYYYKWIYYLNPMAWAFQALSSNEFGSPKYGEVLDNGLTLGETLLQIKGFGLGDGWIGYGYAFLIGYAIFCAVLLGLVLKHVRFDGANGGPNGGGAGGGGGEDEDDDDTKEGSSGGGGAELINLPFLPIDLTFENMSYTVKPSKGGEELTLLNDVSGAFMSGRMCALMGSSGAGKTTLMDVVSMRKTGGTVTGSVCLNGHPQERDTFLRCSGYVEQFDIQSPELTVRETIAFSALLRLSSNFPETADGAGKMRFVDSIIGMLELTDLGGRQVGTYEGGGLTFEQRKRLAIAVELAGSPSVLFLDEPTSGLDSRAALLVMRIMKKIAATGRTVCATIHQPSGAVFGMFDDILLLKTGGYVTYFGELGEDSARLIDFFESNGASPIEHGENPAAWMLSALATKKDGLEVDWAGMYKSSEQYGTLMDRIRAVHDTTDNRIKVTYDSKFATDFRTRMYLMNKRINTIYLRSPAYNLTRLMVAVVYAFIIGSVFLRNSWKDAEWTENEVDGILSTIFLSLIIMGVTSISMIVPVMKQIRDVFYKHRASGMLRHGSLAVALNVGETPYICLVSALFCAVYYSTVGLFHSIEKFAQFWGFFTLNIALYSYFGQAFMCLVKDVPTAGALMGALIGYNVFFSGLIVKPQYFVGPFQLGYWTAPGRFAYEGIITSQFVGLDLTVVAQTESPFYFSMGCNTESVPEGGCTGTMSQYVGYYFGGRFHPDYFWLDVGVLLGYLILTRVLLFWALKRFNYVNT